MKLLFCGPLEDSKYINIFWSRVNKTDNCWDWIGTNRGNGYGCLEINSKLISAHRFSWAIHFGHIPQKLFVLHKCDNKKCVRPDHLFLGNASDNNKDRANKNRSWRPKGTLHPNAKLDEERVLKIRDLYKTSQFSQRELARKFDISQALVWRIVQNKYWKHLS